MKFKKKKIRTCLLGVLLCSGTVYSMNEMKDYSDMSLDELLNVKITTASRSSQSIKDTPISTYVVTRDEILNNNYKSLADVIRNAPSGFATPVSSGYAGVFFMARNQGHWYIKILKDGIPYFPSGQQYPATESEINLKNVDRIEIVYGPASALYGADAVGGVVNIISLNPEKNTARGEIRVGEKGYVYANAYGYGSILEDANKIKLGLYANYYKQDDLKIREGFESVWDKNNPFYKLDPVTAASFPVVTPNAQTMKSPSIGSSFGAEISFRDFKLTYDRRDKKNAFTNSANPNVLFYDENSKYIDTYTRWALQHEYSGDKLAVNSNLSLLKFRLKPDSKIKTIYGQASTNYESYLYNAHDDLAWDEVFNYSITNEIKGTAGFSYTYSGSYPANYGLFAKFDESKYKTFSDKVDISDPLLGNFGMIPQKYNNKGGFVQLAYNTDKINALAGVRYDKHSAYGSTTNPRAAFQYKITENTSVRTSYSTAFKAPSPDITGFTSAIKVTLPNPVPPPATITLPMYVAVPNPALTPEKLKSAELGIRHSFSKNISFEPIYSYSKVTNCFNSARVPIDTTLYPNSLNALQGTTVIKYTNSGKQESTYHVIDLILRGQKLVEAVDLGVDLFYTRSVVRFTLEDGRVLKTRAFVSPSFGRLNIHAKPTEKLYVSLNNFFTGRFMAKSIAESLEIPSSTVPGFMTSDLIVNYEIIKGFKIEGEIDNLFDKKYYGLTSMNYEIERLPQPRRMMYAGVNYTF